MCTYYSNIHWIVTRLYLIKMDLRENYIGKSSHPIEEVLKTKENYHKQTGLDISSCQWSQKLLPNLLLQCQCTVNEFRSVGTSCGDIGFFPHLLLVDTYPNLVKSVWADRAPHIGLSPFDLNMFRQAWLRAKTSDDTKLHWGDAISIEVGQTLLLKKLCAMESKPFTILYDIYSSGALKMSSKI